MPTYHETREEARLMADRLQHGDDRIRAAKVELEPYNGWVVVLIPHYHDLSQYTDTEIRDGRQRAKPVKKAPEKLTKASTGGGKPAGGVTAQVWAIADKLNEQSPISRQDRAKVIDACIEAGINKATAGTQWSKWARKHGL